MTVLSVMILKSILTDTNQKQQKEHWQKPIIQIFNKGQMLVFLYSWASVNQQ